MFDVLNIIDSATTREDTDRFVQLGEDAMFALKRQLPNLPQRTLSTRARRPAGEAQRRKSWKKKNKTKSKKEAAAPKSMQGRAKKRGSKSDDSDSSSQSSALPGFVHGSDHDQDSQTSINSESDNDFA
jgi:hypothetical protein